MTTDELNTDLAADSAPPALRATTENVDDKSIKRTRTVATVILIILILLILLSCAAMFALLRPGGLAPGGQTAGITWVRSIYGHGTTPQDLINPTSATFAPDGNSIWISDNTRFRLVQYDLNGNLMTIQSVRDLPSEGAPDTTIIASYVAIAPNGWFYVAEQTYNRFQIFDNNFVHQATIGFESPLSIAVNNEILVVGSRFGFAAFTPTGEPIGQHGNDFEDEFNRFDYVSGIAVDNENNIFVLDSYNNRLIKYDTGGFPVYEVFLGPAGNQGIEGTRDEDQEELAERYAANLQIPQGITLDGNGRAYIIDLFDFSVAVLDASTGDFIKKVGQPGREDGSFYYPNDINYNPTRDMFVSAEASLGRVQLFTIEGSSTDPFAALNRQFGDVARACFPPFLIILIIIAVYLITRALAKKRREKEMIAALAAGDALDANDTDAAGKSGEIDNDDGIEVRTE